MVVLIPSALQCLVSLRDLSPDHGMFYVLIAVLAAWVADAGAYCAGTLFGKHKLCPEISPKKTVEGAIGGVVVNVAVMLLCGLLFSEFYYQGTAHADYGLSLIHICRRRPVSLSISYLALPPLVISMTAKKSSALMRLGEMSCQMFIKLRPFQKKVL